IGRGAGRGKGEILGGGGSFKKKKKEKRGEKFKARRKMREMGRGGCNGEREHELTAPAVATLRHEVYRRREQAWSLRGRGETQHAVSTCRHHLFMSRDVA